MPPQFRISVHSPATAQAIATVDAGLNDRHFDDVRPLHVLAENENGQVVGGAIGRSWGQCCELQKLWVSIDVRGSGVGTDLIRSFELEAESRGCCAVYLDTFSFQAPAFYRARGYAEILRMEGFTEGVVKHTMRKLLDPAGAETSPRPVTPVGQMAPLVPLMSGAVIRLTPNDAERYARVRGVMLAESPWAFASTPEDDDALDLIHVRNVLGEEENAILAVEAEEMLIATAGIFRMRSFKFAHRAKLWGVFVEARHRGRGLGRAVTTAAIELATRWAGVEFIDLGVSENSLEARRLYASLGFKEWGREPETTRYDGRRYDEIYMALHLDAKR